MILQALSRHYHTLYDDPDTDIPSLGFSNVPVHSAIILSDNGDLLGFTSLMIEKQKGKRMNESPIMLDVPERVGRSGKKISANFLWDNSAYVLGVSDRDETEPAYSIDRFNSFKELNLKLLSAAKCKSAKSVTEFLNNHHPDSFRKNLQFQDHSNLLLSGNLVFKVINQKGYVHDDPEIKEIWTSYLRNNTDAPKGQCLVTGEVREIELTHRKIKGVSGGQSSGTAIVSFNNSAYESFNKTGQQGLNAPVSKEAVFSYTTALNFLLRSPQNHIRFNDTTVVFWAESADKSYVNIFNSILNTANVATSEQKPGRDRKGEEILQSTLTAIKDGRLVDRDTIMNVVKGNPQFHVLGLSPNAARLSIRFYYHDPFIKAVDHLLQHHQDMLITNEYGDQDIYPIWRIIKETVSPKAKHGKPAPLLTGAVFRSILMNLPYPAALYNAIMIRVRADQDDNKNRVNKINHLRAAIIKAYLIRKYINQNKYKEELQMTLNKDSTNQAYVLGRLFAVLERAQQDAAGKELNATIKDRYFTSACASPATAFPILLRLAQHHISKSDYGNFRDRDIQEILDRLDIANTPFPKHLNLDEQGIFVLGYYHQKVDFFKKRTPNIDKNSEEK